MAFVLNCGEFCVFLCNLLLQLEEWCALVLCPPPLLERFFFFFHWCTYCKVFPLPPLLTTSTWPITDDSLYTHKQNKAQTVITELLHTFTHAAQQSVSMSVFLFHPPPSLFFISVSTSLSLTHTQHGCAQSEQKRFTTVVFGNENGNWHQLGKPIK